MFCTVLINYTIRRVRYWIARGLIRRLCDVMILLFLFVSNLPTAESSGTRVINATLHSVLLTIVIVSPSPVRHAASVTTEFREFFIRDNDNTYAKTTLLSTFTNCVKLEQIINHVGRSENGQ